MGDLKDSEEHCQLFEGRNVFIKYRRFINGPLETLKVTFPDEVNTREPAGTKHPWTCPSDVVF